MLNITSQNSRLNAIVNRLKFCLVIAADLKIQHNIKGDNFLY